MIKNNYDLSYLVCSLQNMDHQCNLAYMCKYPYDFWLHNLHWQHNHKDLHIFHFGMQVLLDILDQLGTRRVYTQCKGYPCVQMDTDT